MPDVLEEPVMRTADNYREKDYWAIENSQYAEPSFRLFKCARMINKLANGRQCSLLDVGCGPGALRPLLDRSISYKGIDIAIQQPASYMREVDFAKNPISYDGQKFDFVTALGVLEYMGTLQDQKFQEINNILHRDGRFIMSYINFGHFRHRVWPNYNNVQPIRTMAASLSRAFTIERCFPASHHWRQRQPGKNALPRIQMHVNFNVPVLSPKLAVEYFFVCVAK